MSIKRIFIVISAIFAASAVFADNSSVTSKKYVDDLMSGYQGKLPGSGANKLMIYDAEAGIGEKSIETTLVSNATGVPTVSAVKTGLDGKQDTINGTAGYVMTGTGTPGDVGERAIYSANTNYSNALVTAETVNTGVINAVNSSLIRVNEQGAPSDSGTLWKIQDDLVALNVREMLPDGYTQVNYVTNSASTLVNTGFRFDFSKNYEIELKASGSLGSWYMFQARTQAAGEVSGISGAGSTGSFILGFDTYRVSTSNITRTIGNVYYIKGIIKNGVLTLYVKDETTGTEETVTGQYNAGTGISANIGLFGNTQSQYVAANTDVYMARIKENDTVVMDYVPVIDSGNNAGFWDKVSGTFKTVSTGGLTAGPAVSN